MLTINRKVKPVKWRDVPPALFLYLIFVIIVTIFNIVTGFFGPENLREALMPITGWDMSTCYMFSVFFVVTCCRYPSLGARSTILAFLWLTVLFGVIDILLPWRKDFYDPNPYLRVSPWRPLWTIVIPIVWIIILRTRRITEFCKREHSS